VLATANLDGVTQRPVDLDILRIAHCRVAKPRGYIGVGVGVDHELEASGDDGLVKRELE